MIIETFRRLLFEQDVFWLQVAVDQPSLIQQAETIEQLLCENTDKRRAESAELILLDQLIQIDAEKLEDEA